MGEKKGFGRDRGTHCGKYLRKLIGLIKRKTKDGTLGAELFMLLLLGCHIVLIFTQISSDHAGYYAWIPCLSIPIFVYLFDLILIWTESIQMGPGTSQNWNVIHTRSGALNYKYDDRNLHKERVTIVNPMVNDGFQNTQTYLMTGDKVAFGHSNINFLLSYANTMECPGNHIFNETISASEKAIDGSLTKSCSDSKCSKWIINFYNLYIGYGLAIRPGFQIFRMLYQATWFILWCWGTYYWQRTLEQRDQKPDGTYYKFFQGSWDLIALYDARPVHANLPSYVRMAQQTFTWVFEIDLICRFWIYARSSRSLFKKLFFYTELMMVSPAILLGSQLLKACNVDIYGLPYEDYYQQIFGWLRLVSFINNANDLKNIQLKNGRNSAMIEILLTVTAIILCFGSLMFVVDGYRERNIDGTVDPTTLDSILEYFYFSVVTLTTIGYGDQAPKTLMARLLFVLTIMVTWTLVPQKIIDIASLHKREKSSIGQIPHTMSFADSFNRRQACILRETLENGLDQNNLRENDYCNEERSYSESHNLNQLYTNVQNMLRTQYPKNDVIVVIGWRYSLPS